MKIEFTPVKRVEVALIVIIILFLLELILKGQTQNCENTISDTQIDSSQILGDSAETFVQAITLTAGGTVTSLQVFIHDASGLNVPTKMALYDSGGHLLSSGNATASTAGWFSVPVSNVAILPGNYFVSWDSLGGSHDLTFGYKSGDTPVGYFNNQSTYALFPLPALPGSIVNINGRFAVGVCFSGSTPTPTPSITPTPTATPSPTVTPTPTPTPTPYPFTLNWYALPPNYGVTSYEIGQFTDSGYVHYAFVPATTTVFSDTTSGVQIWAVRGDNTIGSDSVE